MNIPTPITITAKISLLVIVSIMNIELRNKTNKGAAPRAIGYTQLRSPRS